MPLPGGFLRYLRVPWPGRSLGMRPRMIILFGLPFIAIVSVMMYAELFGLPFAGYAGELRDLRAEALNDLDLVADLKEERLARWLEERLNDATVLADGADLQRSLHEALLAIQQAGAGGSSATGRSAGLREEIGAYRELTQDLLLVRDTRGEYASIGIADARTGIIIVSTDKEAVGRDDSGNEHFERVLEPGASNEFIHVMLSSRHASDQLLYPELTVSRSIAATGTDGSNENDTAGVLIMQVRLDDALGQILHTGDGLGQTGEALLVGNDVRILTLLAHPLADGSIAEPLRYQITAAPARYAAGGQSGIMSSRDYRGVKVLAAYRYIPITSEMGWGLVVKQDESEVFAALRKGVVLRVWIGLGGVVLVFSIAFVVATGFTRPIQALESTAARFGRGDRTARVAETVGGEIGRLAREFNEMAASLNQREEELVIRAAALDAAADMVLITDSQGVIGYVNRAFTNGTGYKLEEVVGSTPRILKSGHQDQEFYRDLWDTIMDGQAWSGTLVDRRKDGSEYPVEMTITPVTGDDGVVTQFIAIKRDISERLQAAAERETARDLEARNRELQRVNGARSEFLATVSHELRTPLTAMMAFSEILRHNRESNLTAQQLEQLGLISKGGRRLDGLIEDLLDVSRSETGQFKLELAPFDIQEVIGEVTRSNKSLFDERDQSLKVVNLPEPTWMDGDRRRIMQVFSNLLSNAAKYSPPGTSVELIATVEQNILQVTVRDHGVGISQEDQQGLFNPFFRVANELTRRESGTGLGLVIVKAIVELHGGRVELESQQGVGTTVRTWFPGVLAGPPDYPPDTETRPAN